MSRDVRYRRIYDEPLAEDWVRVLVDRLWPRGMRKEDARIDEWLRDVSPSTELRRWYGHDPDRYDEFRRRYRDEVRTPGWPRRRHSPHRNRRSTTSAAVESGTAPMRLHGRGSCLTNPDWTEAIRRRR